MAKIDFTQITALFFWIRGGCHHLLMGTDILQEGWGSGVNKEVKRFVI